MNNAEWIAWLHVAGLIPTLGRMKGELLLSEQGFVLVTLIGGTLEHEVWEAPAWMDGIGGALLARASALGIAREFSVAGMDFDGGRQ